MPPTTQFITWLFSTWTISWLYHSLNLLVSSLFIKSVMTSRHFLTCKCRSDIFSFKEQFCKRCVYSHPVFYFTTNFLQNLWQSSHCPLPFSLTNLSKVYWANNTCWSFRESSLHGKEQSSDQLKQHRWMSHFYIDCVRITKNDKTHSGIR